MSHRVTLVPGDWVGPETARAVQRIIASAGVDIHWEEHPIVDGLVSEQLLESARSTGRILKNRTKAPRVAGKLPAGVHLRKELGIWAQVREVKNIPGLNARFNDVDLLVVRETSEDIYKGFEHETTPGVYESVKLTTQPACERIARFACELALSKGRKKISIVHKSNIMKKSDGLFLRTARDVIAEYPTLDSEDVIVDALCMRLVKRPSDFDVLVAGNLFGDIVGDLATGLAGGISVGGSVNLGDGIKLFENPHGKAESLVGTGRANPIPNLMIALPLLEDLGEERAAGRIRDAVHGALADGLTTVDCGGADGCDAVVSAVEARL
ncbi:MAG: isocitrate/isopropylmalate family dehydrogenase [Myxococcota bacterium]|nr:isocitrate/isopropylmalate family dehydrogenase [Myxococcota bacterium]